MKYSKQIDRMLKDHSQPTTSTFNMYQQQKDRADALEQERDDLNRVLENAQLGKDYWHNEALSARREARELRKENARLEQGNRTMDKIRLENGRMVVQRTGVNVEIETHSLYTFSAKNVGKNDIEIGAFLQLYRDEESGEMVIELCTQENGGIGALALEHIPVGSIGRATMKGSIKTILP